MHRFDSIGLLVVVLLVGTHGSRSLHGGAASPAEIVGVDGTTSAGSLIGGVLTVDLVARPGFVSGNERDLDVSHLTLAFGEVGKPLQIPGPTIRVNTGTRVRITLRNATSTHLLVQGLGRAGTGDSLVVPPRARRTVGFEALMPGSYAYVGIPVGGEEGEAVTATHLGGVIVVEAR